MLSATPEAKESEFLQWLLSNGASFPKLRWPVATCNGCRGAIALEEIAPNEPMIIIPKRLMITEESCLRDPELGTVFEDNADVFPRDDPVISFFLVHQMVLGKSSFFHPYMKILPYPETIFDWDDKQRAQLCDDRLVQVALARHEEIRSFYMRIFTRLNEKYPNRFPTEQYTFERFVFAWKTIQARAFGRRLPWTALVPFADCLNHSNIATKYDFNVDRNDAFRLFPSKTTRFAKGSEVFNSYGRRNNFQLLLDYGFAIPFNEWEVVEIHLPRWANGSDPSRPVAMKRSFIRMDLQSSFEEFLPHARLVCENSQGFNVQNGQPAPMGPNGLPSPPKAAQRLRFLGATSIPRDIVALRWQKQVLEAALSMFGVSTDQDDQLLRRTDLDFRFRMAVIYRNGRMRIILKLLRDISEAINLLEQLQQRNPADGNPVNEDILREQNPIVFQYYQQIKLVWASQNTSTTN